MTLAWPGGGTAWPGLIGKCSNIAAMPGFDLQDAAAWLPFAGVIGLLLALRLATRWRRRRQASAPDPGRRAADPRGLKRARLIFLLAVAALTLILATAIQSLLQ